MIEMRFQQFTLDGEEASELLAARLLSSNPLIGRSIVVLFHNMNMSS